MRRALVFGGTGALGREVLRALARANVPTVFTYHRSREAAQVLATEHGQRAVAVDLGEPPAIRRLVAELAARDEAPSVFIHAAAQSRDLPLDKTTDDDWRVVHSVNAQSAFVAAQALAPGMARLGGGDMVFCGALDPKQSIPIPVHFAASQGALSAMTMALAKELGPQNIRVNLVALGILGQGLSQEIAPKLLADYKTFSALRRVGTPAEAARAVVWLALENRYMSGRVLPVNGGI